MGGFGEGGLGLGSESERGGERASENEGEVFFFLCKLQARWEETSHSARHPCLSSR